MRSLLFVLDTNWTPAKSVLTSRVFVNYWGERGNW